MSVRAGLSGTARCVSLESSGPRGRARRLEHVRDLGLFGNGIESTASAVTAVAAFGPTPDFYEETIGNAILLGGDTDTIAAMAGAISGPTSKSKLSQTTCSATWKT